eukprot:GFYU01005586.1.p1 GENE.GFYU01005586.1~~GFYU01005586.1.p1  ORF type:complete len:613 (-),score=89.15 GFYU01005586.1:535-2373(-)
MTVKLCQNGQCAAYDATLRCSRCKLATYCGRECQKAAWSVHKRQCVSVDELWEKLKVVLTRERFDKLIKSNPGAIAYFQNMAMSLDEPQVIEMGIDLRLNVNMVDPRRGTLRKWHSTARPGDVHDANSLSNFTPEWTCRQFSNSPPLPLLSPNHLAVGFVDLGILAYAARPDHTGSLEECRVGTLIDWLSEDKDRKIRFVGYDATAFNVAFSMVIWELAGLVNVKANRKEKFVLCQVWYSTVWCTTTLKYFKRAVNNILERGNVSKAILPKDGGQRSVHDWLTEWKRAEIKSEEYERWHNTLVQQRDCLDIMASCFSRREDHEVFSEFAERGRLFQTNVKKGDDLMPSLTWLTEQERRSGQAFPEVTGKSSYLTVPYKSLIHVWSHLGRDADIEEHVRGLMLDGVDQLVAFKKSGRVTVELHHAYVSKDTLPADNSFKSVSWSNIPDYFMEAPHEFHQLCQQIPHDGCLHVAYSLNWMTRVYGCELVDYAKTPEKMKEMVEAALTHLDELHAEFNTSDLIADPAFTGMGHPLGSSRENFVGPYAAKMYSKQWLEYMMNVSKDPSLPQPYLVQAEPLNAVAPVFAACPERITYAWTYDKKAVKYTVPSVIFNL